MVQVSAKTKQLGIIGCPVEHSFSPKMHNFIAPYMGDDYIYTAWDVKPENVKDAIAGIRALGIRGVNVTAPHKTAVMPYLDEVTDAAKKLGSVNTIVNDNGWLRGYNTDADGFCKAITANGINPSGAKILVLGAGGVVKPTLTRLIWEKPAQITVLNRTRANAERLAMALKADTGFEIKTEFTAGDFDIVINTTSAGMEPQENTLPIEAIDELDDLSFINSGTAVIDMIYNPDETLFLKEAKKRGAKTMNGLGMLIYQGLIAYELFTGTKLPANMADIIKKEVFKR